MFLCQFASCQEGALSVPFMAHPTGSLHDAARRGAFRPAGSSGSAAIFQPLMEPLLTSLLEVRHPVMHYSIDGRAFSLPEWQCVAGEPDQPAGGVAPRHVHYVCFVCHHSVDAWLFHDWRAPPPSLPVWSQIALALRYLHSRR